jgi:hypothetical protein
MAKYFDEEPYRVLVSQVTLSRAGACKPQELSNIIWALATAGVMPAHIHAFDTTCVHPKNRINPGERANDPVTECLAAAANELMTRPSAFKEQEIKDVLWSFSKVRCSKRCMFNRGERMMFYCYLTCYACNI